MDDQTKITDVFNNCSKKMATTILSLKKEYTKVSTGRANPAILDNIRVNYYDQMTPINQLGNISFVDQSITITAWEKKILPEIEREILKANIGLVPQNDGNQIRIPIQPLTEERRKEMVKLISKIGEEHKTSIRNLRRDANHELSTFQKEKIFGEDEISKANNHIQKITNDYIIKIDQLNKSKVSELLSE